MVFPNFTGKRKFATTLPALVKMFLIVNIVEAGSGDCKIRGRMFDANWRSQSINWAHVQNLPPNATIPVSVVTGKWRMVEVGLNVGG